VTLSLIAGPANAGKVALLLDRYLERLADEPFLIVPNGSDIDRVERDLLRRRGCLLGGSIGTFDDLFERIAKDDTERRPVANDIQRAFVARSAVEATRARLDEFARSARSGGFLDTLIATLGELESGLVDPCDLGGELAELYTAYRAELDRLGLWDRNVLRRRAAERVARDFEAWNREPIFAYGFEDLTAAEWSLLEALSGRVDVQVSLPYEPGRVAFASLQRTAQDLARLSVGQIDELAPRSAEYAAPGLAHLERTLFEPDSAQAQTHGAVRLLEGAGTRGTLELVASELLTLLREGTRAEQIAVIVPSVDRWRAPLDTVLGSAGIPYAVEGRVRVGATPLGQALQSLLRFAWTAAERRELYAYLRSPYSGLSRSSVDFVEGRLRGRAVHEHERVETETERLREAPLVALRELRAANSPLEGTRALLHAMVRSAYGLDAPPVGEAARADLRCYAALTALFDELETWGELSQEDLLTALDRCEVLLWSSAPPGRVAVLDLLRARTRRFDVVLVLGLEEGSLPRRDRPSAFLDDDRRRELGGRLERPDSVSRDRYLFYTACTRATRRLYLVREAAGDDGSVREPSPFWDEAKAVFDPDELERWTRRRALSDLTWPIDSAPSERERLRSLAELSVDPVTHAGAVALGDANGWARRLNRARHAFDRRTRLKNPQLLAEFGARRTFAATELERFADCSSAWLFERVIDPKTIDAEADAMLRGKVAHQALYAFYSGLPKELGSDRVTPENLAPATRFLERCLDDALRGGVRLDLTDVEAAELREGLRLDLERFLQEEADSPVTLLPRRFEVGFGNDRSAPELQRGIDLGGGLSASGKIDRIDVDPFSARGILQDYKSGKGAFSARQIDDERRLQVPLYMLVLRDLVGVEPLGGVYRALSGSRGARGMLRAEARDDLPGFSAKDYLDEETFWAQVETARGRAYEYAERMRAGDVRHDPKGDECPSWCDLWSMCRVRHA
jgi:ATP-dependent helicase/DNAse subunit B